MGALCCKKAVETRHRINSAFTKDQEIWIDQKSKEKVQECINELNSDEEKVRRIVGNIRKRAELCIQENGGHFEHLL